MKKLITLLAIFVLASCSKEIEAPEVPAETSINHYLFCSTSIDSVSSNTRGYYAGSDIFYFYISISKTLNSSDGDTWGLISKGSPNENHYWFKGRGHRLENRWETLDSDDYYYSIPRIRSTIRTSTTFFDDKISIWASVNTRYDGFSSVGSIEISRLDLGVYVEKRYATTRYNNSDIKPKGANYKGQCKKINEEAFMFEYESEVKKKQLLIDKAVEEARKEKEEIIKKRVL